jgi:hypothetical protein
MGESEEEGFTRDLVLGQIAYAKQAGMKIYLSPNMTTHAKRLGVYDASVHVEVGVLPTEPGPSAFKERDAD